jgi:hypothetical protein
VGVGVVRACLVVRWWDAADGGGRDIQSKKATAMDFMSNAFCASGASYPNGTVSCELGGDDVSHEIQGHSSPSVETGL